VEIAPSRASLLAPGLRYDWGRRL